MELMSGEKVSQHHTAQSIHTCNTLVAASDFSK